MCTFDSSGHRATDCKNCSCMTSGKAHSPDAQGVCTSCRQQVFTLPPIMEFDFSGYGMDDVDEVKGGDWHSHLASEIASALFGGSS